MKTIYLDYAATTPLDPAVIDTMHSAGIDKFANPSSLHHSGQWCKTHLEEAREGIARSIGAHPSEIVFTGNGSESNNLAIIGTAYALKDRGKHIITTSVEHPSVLRSCDYLKEIGFEIDYAPVNDIGRIQPDWIFERVKKDTIIVSMMYVNNETGNIYPVKEIAGFCREKGIRFHTDAVQAFGKVSCSVRELGVDLMTVNAHKIYGPKGVSALYIRKGHRVKPLIFGGSQEGGLRAGTENLIGIAGFAKAVEILQKNTNEYNNIKKLRDNFEKQLQMIDYGILVNGDINNRVATHSNLYFPMLKNDSLLIRLDMEKIEVSAGAACHSGSATPSHVLTAMGFSPDRLTKSVRFSFGRFTTDQQISKVVKVLRTILTNEQ